MGGRDEALERLRNTLVGYSQDALCGFLEDGGYEFQRHARHGSMYRHPRLARDHPDLAIRKRFAYVVVQKGAQVKAAAARDVRDALEVLEGWEAEHE